MNIRSALTTVKRNIVKYAAKGAGVAALGIVAYDAHVVGKLQSDIYSKTKDAEACMQTFSNTQYLSSPSVTTSNLKKSVFNLEVESNLRHFINSGIGYFKGFGSMLIDSVVPFTLGLTALCGKGKWSKGSAIGLGIYAGVKLFKDILGFCHYNALNHKF